jgi:hypothetical protein
VKNVKGSVSDKHREYIFKSMSGIIIKNVNNFFNLIKGVDNSLIIHEKDDIVSECYLILNKCIEKFDISLKDSKFYFYYNKALSSGLYRIQERTYHGRYENVCITELNRKSNKVHTLQPSNPLLLDLSFSENEILLINSRVEQISMKDFCLNNNISKVEYNNMLSNIKDKINKGCV